MTESDTRVEKLLAVISALPDQTHAGRARAYRQLRIALVDELSKLKKTAPGVITSVRQDLEKIVRDTEYRITNGRPYKGLSGDYADSVLAIRDQIRFMEQSEHVRDDRGPQYGVDRDGKLTLLHQIAPSSELISQRPLHLRLRKTAGETVERLAGVVNQYPQIVSVTGEYLLALSGETEALDPINLWSIGNGVAALVEAYRSQDVAATLSHPLEPGELAALERLVREHGAFIMGFASARELIERADQFALNTSMLREIQPSGMRLLNELSDNRALVSDETRRVHRSLRDAASATGWTVGRAGYTSYIAVRNSVSAIVRGSIGDDRSIVTWFGLTSVIATASGTTESVVLREGAEMLSHYGPTLTQFFAHSPEFLSLVQWALSILEQDRKLGRADNE